MEYQLDIIINKPLAEVVKLMDDPANLKKWQPELVSFEHIGGKERTAGQKSKIVYLMGKKECEMIETIESHDLPDLLITRYETDGVVNRVENHFKAVGADQTHWMTKNQFKFTSIGMKLMGFFMKKAFPKQTMNYMQRFKDFAENTPS
ncbi:SRPBCC family protein [Kangiella sediminilitoris]|uniref:SRPBCC family protein n=1 Tax=Kangiella sediminilitoris TaxID=1144748 RepID=A0A1B3B9Y6_9GAMM|nr:SRPBCC family protein [Kangiella sediminilitoris]AOE49611.1 hypothetical protein KS2013_889 [Kangiella sediminilitoris]